MKILDLKQGTQEWLKVRAKYHTASEAPAMMGCSSFLKRTDLLDFKSGFQRPDSDFMQKIYNEGHAAEAAGRAAVEKLHDVDFWPAVGVSDCGKFLASFDGITSDGKMLFENKLWSQALQDQIDAGDLSPQYYWQLEHQLLVSGAEKVLFVACNTDATVLSSIFYQSRPDRRALLLGSWAQFDIDLKNHVVVDRVHMQKHIPAALPVVKIQLAGAVVLVENLGPISTALKEYVDGLPATPSSDEDFGQIDAAAKLLKKLEESLREAEAAALSQADSIEAMRSKVAAICKISQTNRLKFEKIVLAEKQRKITEMVDAAVKKYNEALDSANLRFECAVFEVNAKDSADFAASIKGLKTPPSMADALQVCLAAKLVEFVNKTNLALKNLEIYQAVPVEVRGFFDKKTCLKMATFELESLISDRIQRYRESIAKQEMAAADAREAAAKTVDPASPVAVVTPLSEAGVTGCTFKTNQGSAAIATATDAAISLVFGPEILKLADTGNAAEVLKQVVKALAFWRQKKTLI